MAIPDCRAGATKSSAAVLAKFLHLERVPKDCREWHVNATNASALADTLCREWDRAVLFRRLATLRTDIAVFNDVEELRWKGPTNAFDKFAAGLDAARIEERAATPRSKRAQSDRSGAES